MNDAQFHLTTFSLTSFRAKILWCCSDTNRTNLEKLKDQWIFNDSVYFVFPQTTLTSSLHPVSEYRNSLKILIGAPGWTGVTACTYYLNLNLVTLILVCLVFLHISLPNIIHVNLLKINHRCSGIIKGLDKKCLANIN